MRPEAGPISPCLAYRYVPYRTGHWNGTRVHMRVQQHRMFARCVFVLADGSTRGGLGAYLRSGAVTVSFAWTRLFDGCIVYMVRLTVYTLSEGIGPCAPTR